MSDAYQVLMADTQRGRPPGPASRVCVCVEVTEASPGDHCPLAPSHLIMLRPVLKIADMSSFYARVYVNLVLPAPPTGPADTLVLAKSSQNTDTQTKSISVLIAAKSTNNWDQVAGRDIIILLLSSPNW